MSAKVTILLVYKTPKHTKYFTDTYGKCYRAQAANWRVYLKGELRFLVQIRCNSTGATAICTTHWSDCSPIQPMQLQVTKGKGCCRVQFIKIWVVYSWVSPPSLMLFSNVSAVRTYFLYIPYVLLGGLNCAYLRISNIILHRRGYADTMPMYTVSSTAIICIHLYEGRKCTSPHTKNKSMVWMACTFLGHKGRFHKLNSSATEEYILEIF